jgi:heme exporter protein CcmB
VPLRAAYRAALEQSGSEGSPRHAGHDEAPASTGRDTGPGDDVAAVLRTARLVAAKDLRVEWRQREGLLTTLFFALSCVLIFSFGLVREGRPSPDVGPGVLWVAIAFAGTLAMARAFERERAAGTLTAVLLSPAARAGVYLGKWWSLLLLLLAVEVVLLPLVSLFFQMPLAAHGAAVAAVVVAGTAGYAAVGTLFAAMLSRTSTRDVLLPLLLYPMTVPVVIGGVRGTAAALAEPPDAGGLRMWLALLVCFGAVFVTLSLWTFDTLMTDAAPRPARGD